MEKLSSSFRDPSGYVYEEGGELYRQVLPPGVPSLERLMGSGLATRLMERAELAGFTLHGESALGPVLRLTRLPYISYPYEWSFGQLRDAGLLTLRLMSEALKEGLALKDASAFNVAYDHCRPVFLDHTSFEVYREGEPWRAYRQFAMHFLAPLLLMRDVDLRCLALFREDIGGIPLDLASRLLPRWTWLQPNPLLHLHLHAAMERRYSQDSQRQTHRQHLPKSRLQNLLQALEAWLESLQPPHQRTQWADYAPDTSYDQDSFAFKQEAVRQFCRRHHGQTAIDLGANSGIFSRIASNSFPLVIAADSDATAVERLYELGKSLNANLQPLLLDLNTPSPDLGVLGQERSSFFARTRADVALGLALIHHLRITGNWSLHQIVTLFRRLAPKALVEFVPLEDRQVRQLTRGRETIYQDWTLERLKEEFLTQYATCDVLDIPNSGRRLLALLD